MHHEERLGCCNLGTLTEAVGQGNWQGSLMGLFTPRVVGAGLVQLGPDVLCWE